MYRGLQEISETSEALRVNLKTFMGIFILSMSMKKDKIVTRGFSSILGDRLYFPVETGIWILYHMDQMGNHDKRKEN